MSEKVTLSGVPETMLQTVYARAKESRTRGAIQDKKAEEFVEKLEYDFSLADKDAAMHDGVIARTIVLDRLGKGITLPPIRRSVVVNIACGLDTRCYRMQGYAHWYNLDLPETIADPPEKSFAGGAEPSRRSPCQLWRTAARRLRNMMFRHWLSSKG